MKVSEISVKTQQWFIHSLPLSPILISATLSSELVCSICVACSLGCSLLNFLHADTSNGNRENTSHYR